MRKVVFNKSFSNSNLDELDKQVNEFKKSSGFNCIATSICHVNTERGVLFSMTVFYEQFL